MLSTLSKDITECCMYGEIISNQGFVPLNGITMSEMIRFDMLQFLAYITETDGNLAPELGFISTYLKEYFTSDRLMKFKYERTANADFAKTAPRSLTYFISADASGRSSCTTKGYTKSRNLIETYRQLGLEYMACDSVTSETELKMFTEYMDMLEKTAKANKVYEASDLPKGPVTPAKPITKTPVNGSSASNAATLNVVNNAIEETKQLKAMQGEVTKESVGEEQYNLDELLAELNELTGLENVKKDIKQLINLLKVSKLRRERGIKEATTTLHMVFSGNPGTGKTTVARLLSKIYKCLGVCKEGQLVEVDRSGLVEGYVGQTAIKTKEVCESALGGILFVDEAYTLTFGKDNKDFGQEAVDEMLKMMEDHRDNLVVIVAGYTDPMQDFVESNPGLKSRFNKYIFFEDYTPDELFAIFMSMAKKQEYVPNEPAKKYLKEHLIELVANKDDNFANAREMRNYLERAIARQASRIVDMKDITDKQLKTLTKADLVE